MIKQKQKSLNITLVDWTSQKSQLQHIREQVFIQEQGVPVELEWDDMDDQALHVLAQSLSEGKILAIGTARIIIKNKQAHIGRMAVLPQWRNQGVGAKILHYCIELCRQRDVDTIVLNAQVYVLPFYEKAGFKISSEEFMDAGILHKKMTLSLSES